MAGPNYGNGVVAGHQGVDVVTNQPTRDLDGVLVVVAGALRPRPGGV